MDDLIKFSRKKCISKVKKKSKYESFLLKFQIFNLFNIYYMDALFICFRINKLLRN